MNGCWNNFVLKKGFFWNKKQFEKKTFVNPGSVGQPRDRKVGAAWALLDSDSGVVDFKRERYDMTSIVEEAREINPDLPYLSEVLLRQWRRF